MEGKGGEGRGRGREGKEWSALKIRLGWLQIARAFLHSAFHPHFKVRGREEGGGRGSAGSEEGGTRGAREWKGGGAGREGGEGGEGRASTPAWPRPPGADAPTPQTAPNAADPTSTTPDSSHKQEPVLDLWQGSRGR